MMQPRRMMHNGGSMSPMLRHNDVLNVKECAMGEVSAGDVIIFTHPQTKSFIVHRIMSIGAEGLHTRGDNNLGEDPYIITKEMFLGRVESAFRSRRTVRVHRGRIGKAIGRSCHVLARCKYTWKVTTEHIVRLKLRWT